MDPVLNLLAALRAHDSSWMKRRRKLDTAMLFAIPVQKRGRGSVLDALATRDQASHGDPEVVQCAMPAVVTRALTKMPTDTFKQVHEELVLSDHTPGPLAPHFMASDDENPRATDLERLMDVARANDVDGVAQMLAVGVDPCGVLPRGLVLQ